MADSKHPQGPQDPAIAPYGDLPPPPPGPPPSQAQQPQVGGDSHPNPLDANPTNVMDEQQRQQQELLDYYSKQHQQKLQGGAVAQDLPTQHTTDEYRPPQPPRPTQPQDTQQQYTIPQYNPADPAFANSPVNAIPQDTQLNTAGAGATGPATGHPTSANPTSASPTSPNEDENKGSKWSARFSNLGIKAAAPINQLAHKLGSQSFLPETMNKECDKAASILQSFCKSGVYADPSTNNKMPTSLDPNAKETSDGIIDPTKEKPKERVIVTIPPKVIARALGLAIFTTFRAGFNVTGATGSGILIARLDDGTWGPPSGIQVHSVGGGFTIGVDIYDCVCVINSKEALAAFTNTRVSLGSDLAVTAGPYGAGGAMEVGHGIHERKPSGSRTPPPPAAEPSQTLKPEDKKSHRRSLSANAFKPVFSYVKSRGFYAGIRVDGTVVVERKEANAAFYGTRVSVEQIIKGQVPVSAQAGPDTWPAGAQALMAALKHVERGAVGGEGSPALTPVDAPHADTAAAVPGSSVSGGAGPGEPSIGSDGLPAYDERLSKPATGDYKYA